MRVFILAMLVFLSIGSQAQNAATPPPPCSAPEVHQFDFWLGTWDAVYSDTVHASNTITKEQDGCVVHEHFSDPSKKYTGESWSVYNIRTKQWQQTWVDNIGGYIQLTGTFKNGKMTLTTPSRPYKDGKTITSRMVYQNITPQSFDWIWEATTDGGKTWVPNWVIHYKRKG